MAKLVTNIQETDKTAQGKSFDRMEGLPLDSTSVWNSLSSLQSYAAQSSTSPQTTSYVGQIVSVVRDTEVVPYQIYNSSGTLKRIPYKEEIYTLDASDLNTDSSRGFKPITIADQTINLVKKTIHTPQSGNYESASLPMYFKGIRVSTDVDYAYFGINPSGELHSVFYNGGESAQGFTPTRVYKSYESGSPSFTDVNVTNTVTCKNVMGLDTGSTYINSRTAAVVVQTNVASTNAKYHPIFSSKTPQGEVSCGVLGGEENLRWMYTSDNQYTSNRAANRYLEIMKLTIHITEDNSNTFKGHANLVVSGSVSASSFIATSDKRLKENVKPHILNDKKSILDLPIYKFDYIDGDKNKIGCMAQDLMEICPEIVHTNDNGYLTIEESKIVYLLIEEVKQLRKELAELRSDYANT